MPPSPKTLRTCPNGHQYYKSSDCPVCPICEQQREPASAFLAQLSAPAQRALASLGIRTLAQLATHTEKELLALHGFGSASLPKLRKALEEEGLTFRRTGK